MHTYLLLTKLRSDALRSPRSFLDLERAVKRRIERDCPEVRWKESYALLGEQDYADLFEAPDNETALQVATLIRVHGHAYTTLVPALPWKQHKAMLRRLQEAQEQAEDVVVEAGRESFPASDPPAW